MSSKAIQRRYQRIIEIGCICCRRYGYLNVPVMIHHLNLGQHAGQKRLGDDHTIGLCPWHHVSQTDGRESDWWESKVGPSLALSPVKFREIFGDDLELLAEQDRLIAQIEKQVVGA